MTVDWMPGVTHIDRSGANVMATDGSPVVVLHITVTNEPASYKGTEPHFEVAQDGSVIQYVAMSRNAKALWNEPAGVETNRQGICHQIEMVWEDPLTCDQMSDVQLRAVAAVCVFIHEQTGVRFVPPPMGFYSDERPLASVDGVLRMSFDEWTEWNGFVGHVNVPENDHWDPGRFPWDRFMSHVNQLTGEDTMQVDERDALLFIQTWVKGFAGPVLQEMKDLYAEIDPQGQRDYVRGRAEFVRKIKALQV